MNIIKRGCNSITTTFKLNSHIYILSNKFNDIFLRSILSGFSILLSLCMKAHIRKATIEDCKHVYELIKEFAGFQKTPEKVKITVDNMIKQNDYFNCLVAEDDKEMIVGYTNYSIIYYSWVGKSIYLDDLYVKPSHRGNGIGSKLMQEVFKIARREKCNRVRWQVSGWNKNAIEFYKRIGAEIDDIEKNCDLILN